MRFLAGEVIRVVPAGGGVLRGFADCYSGGVARGPIMSEQLLTALRESTLDEKRRAFAELAKELLAEGTGVVPIQDEQEHTVGYLTPPNGPAAFFPTDPAWIEEMKRRAENPGRTYSVEEFIRELKKRLAQRAKG